MCSHFVHALCKFLEWALGGRPGIAIQKLCIDCTKIVHFQCSCPVSIWKLYGSHVASVKRLHADGAMTAAVVLFLSICVQVYNFSQRPTKRDVWAGYRLCRQITGQMQIRHFHVSISPSRHAHLDCKARQCWLIRPVLV